MKEVEVYAVGLVCASVCADKGVPIEEIEEQVNIDYPTGISSRWKLSEDATFANGPPNPCVCEHDDGRLHWLLNC